MSQIKESVGMFMCVYVCSMHLQYICQYLLTVAALLVPLASNFIPHCAINGTSNTQEHIAVRWHPLSIIVNI